MNAQLLENLQKISDEEEEILSGSRKIKKSLYSDSPDFTIESSKMIADDPITFRCHTRFVPFPKHRHNYIEIVYMCTGSTTHIINDKTSVVLGQGELLFMNQHTYHEILPAGLDDIAVNFMVKPSFFDVPMNMLEDESVLSRFLIGTLCRDTPDVNYLHFKVSDILPVQNLVENLIWSIRNSQLHSRHVVQLTMGLLFLQLLSQTDRIVRNDAASYAHALVMTALRYIEENYAEASLTELSARMNQPVSQYSRIIKSGMGLNFKELLLRRRFSRAENLLLHSSLSISDIIASVGYDNSSYFYRVFRERYGLSPKEFRREAAAKTEQVKNEDTI